MEEKESFTNVRSLLGALAEAMNLINPDMEHHHEQTAYLAYQIARELKFSDRDIERTICAALLHDIGSIMFEKQCTIAEVERHAKTIAKLGADMLRDIPFMGNIADIIEHCQSSWKDCTDDHGQCYVGARIAAVIHLADAVSFVVRYDQPVLNQTKKICAMVEAKKGTEFSEEAVEAFLHIAELEYIWFDLMYHPSFLMIFAGDIRPLSLEQTVGITKVMSRIIDYRSSFTAMHSAGVAASAEKLAELSGMTKEECLMMRIAGNLHDVGKLKVPSAILEKPGKLTEEEFNVIKEHPYNTRLILMDVDGFERIADWAGFHHEKLNGRGYPFHFGENYLDAGSRIMAVADIFSAITEERPYRAGMKKEQVIKIMKENVSYGAICGDLVNLLIDHYEEIDDIRDEISREAGKRYFDSIEGRGIAI